MAGGKPRQQTGLMASPGRAGGWLALALTLALPFTARAEPVLPYDLGQKAVLDRKAKTLVGPSVQIDDQGHVALVWVEEDKDVRSVFFARSTVPGGPVGTPVAINRPDETPYWRQEAPALVVQGNDAFVTWGADTPEVDSPTTARDGVAVEPIH